MTIEELKEKIKDSVHEGDVINTKKYFAELMESITDSIYDEYKDYTTQNFLLEGEELEDEEEDEEEFQEEDGLDDDEKHKEDELEEGEDKGEEEDEEDDEEEKIAESIVKRSLKRLQENGDMVADYKTKDQEDKEEIKDDTAKTKKSTRTKGKVERTGKK